MSSFAGNHPASVDLTDLSGLDKIVAAYKVGADCVIVHTVDARDIRITAWRNLATGEYVADFERRSTFKSGSKEMQVWAQTRAYARCTGEDRQSCLEAAVLEVDRVHLY
jgi:hypothetical protein